MKIQYSSFHTQKLGNPKKDYEDAYYPIKDKIYEGEIQRFAISDGASESLLSGKWAEILIKIYVRIKKPNECIEKFIDTSYNSWNYWKASYLKKREKKDKPIQWYEEPGLQRGAFSTLLGLSLKQGAEAEIGVWDAIAIGDSCLFQFRDDNIIEKLPIDNSDQFNNQPSLISSNPDNNKEIFHNFKKCQGIWHTKDIFLMMTDAIACWFLQECEKNNNPIYEIKKNVNYKKPQQFCEWINSLRNNEEIRNDDVTLTCIEMI